MTKFSDSIGVTQPRQLQLRSMDEPLRNALWNWITWAFENENRSHAQDTYAYWMNAARRGVWDEVFHWCVDDIPRSYEIPSVMKKWFFSSEWYEAFNLVQYILGSLDRFLLQYAQKPKTAAQRLNYYLEREMSGYRAIGTEIVEITAPAEIAAIEEAARRKSGFEGVAEHINTALELLGKKPEPDYRNSIKESISAVEATVKLLAGEKSGGIDAALKILDGKNPLHPAFKSALSKLYGYTSDAGGIRHPILDESQTDPNFAEAKFMLVACSAFANFLIDSSR